MGTVIIVGALIFAIGVVAGVIIIVSLGIKREERDFSMTRRAPDRVSSGARSLTSLCVGQRTDSRSPAARYEDTLV